MWSVSGLRWRPSQGGSSAEPRSPVRRAWCGTFGNRRCFRSATPCADGSDSGLIRDLDSYLFGAFAHRLREVLRKERTIEFIPSNRELEELKQTQDWSWVAAFENALQLKAVLDDMDDRMKEVLYRWAFDEPWDEISGDMGVTTNALKKRFAYHLKKLRSRMLNANKPVSTKG